MLQKSFFAVNLSHTLIFSSPWWFYLWGADLCSSTILFCSHFVLKGRCPYILGIWLFSTLESMVSFYMLWKDMWLVGDFFFAFVVSFDFSYRYVYSFCKSIRHFLGSLMIPEISFVINWCMEDGWCHQKFVILSNPGDFHLCVFLSVFITSSIVVSLYIYGSLFS